MSMQTIELIKLTEVIEPHVIASMHTIRSRCSDSEFEASKPQMLGFFNDW